MALRLPEKVTDRYWRDIRRVDSAHMDVNAIANIEYAI